MKVHNWQVHKSMGAQELFCLSTKQQNSFSKFKMKILSCTRSGKLAQRLVAAAGDESEGGLAAAGWKKAACEFDFF